MSHMQSVMHQKRLHTVLRDIYIKMNNNSDKKLKKNQLQNINRIKTKQKKNNPSKMFLLSMHLLDRPSQEMTESDGRERDVERQASKVPGQTWNRDVAAP